MTDNSNMNESAITADRDLQAAAKVKELENELAAAMVAVETEDSMTFWEGVRLYPKAAVWSLLLSVAVIMEGFDCSLISNFYAYPSFQKKFGHPTADDGYQLTAAWQSGLGNGAAVGEIIGLFINGIVAERYGYRKTMMAALFSAICFIFLPFFGKNIQTLEAYEILMGIPWGIFQTLTMTYASEVCPVVLRGYLTIWVNMCWHIGSLISVSILRGLLNRTDTWGYRIPFALQWVWPVPLILVSYFCPESPWWLVRRGRHEDALKSIRRLLSQHPTHEEQCHQTLAMMINTHKVELATSSGATFVDCFKGVNFRRTEIACITWAIQAIAQSPLNGAYFFDQAGLKTSDSFDLTLGQYGAEIVGTIGAWLFLPYFGHRTIYLMGFIIIVPVSFIMGALGVYNDKSSTQWAAGGLVLVNYLVYSLSIGSLTYTIVPEVSSSRLRTKVVILARNLYNVVGIINGVLVPHMVNKTAWNWGAKAAFFFGTWQLIAAIWAYFRLPETGGRTYAELDTLFNQKVSARKFSSTVIEPFEEIDPIEEVEQDEKPRLFVNEREEV